MKKQTNKIKDGQSTDKRDGNGRPEEQKASQEKREEPIAADYVTAEQDEQTAPEPTPEEQIAALTDRLQRLAAEFENYKKKNAREFERGHKAGAVAIVERLLPVLDSFDSALKAENDADESGIAEGLRKIHKQLLQSMTDAGLEIIEPAKGDAFDPNIHEVLFCQQTEEVPEDHVFTTLQRGYTFKGWLVRAAKVQLAKVPKTECDE